MTPSRIWTLGAVVAVVVITGGAVALGVQPSLAAAAASDTSATQVDQGNDTTQIELARLSRLAATETDLQQDESTLASAVTGSLRLTTFSQQVRDTAALDGVKITALQPGTGVPYVSPVSAAAPVPASTATPTPSATPTAVVAPVAASGQFGKTDPLITSSDLVLIPVTVVVSGSEAAGIAFAQDVQHMKRLFAVDTVTYSNPPNSTVAPTTTISGTIYALKR